MKKILLATDGSKPAHHAASFLARLPHDGEFDLTIVSVLMPPYQGRTTFQLDWVETCLEQARRHAEKDFEVVKAMFEGACVAIEHVVVIGNAGEKICEIAESRGCDLVVIGAKGHSAVSRILLGSTSDYVATKACCSVLVVRPAEPARSGLPLRIVLGYEDTGPSQAATEEIAEIKWGKQAEFHLVTVSYVYGLMGSELLHRLRESGHKLAAELRKIGIDAIFHLVENDHLGEGLVNYAEDRGCDVFVVGETPRSQLGRVLMGSTSRYVLRHTPCSVWITRNRMIHGLNKAERKRSPTSQSKNDPSAIPLLARERS